MTANNKEEFFSLLENELKRIGVENYDEIKEDFEQHFEESAEQGDFRGGHGVSAR